MSALQHLSLQLNTTICDELIDDNVSYKRRVEAVEKAQKWRYIFDKSKLIYKYFRCETLKTVFGFNERPLSDEEAEYPLAYGIVAYKHIDQIYYMLSAFYHPQNLYCIALDSKASFVYKKQVDLLQLCFPNIRHIDMKIEWCEYGILRGVMSCVEYLVQSSNKWKYYQYLSGFDLPIKTNHEMVRIFKQLNNTINMEILRFPIDFCEYTRNWSMYNRKFLFLLLQRPVPYGMNMFKSSVSALIPHRVAKEMVENEKAVALYKYLNGTICPDESFWLTAAGNKKIFPMPGSINATKWLDFLEYRRSIEVARNLPIPYYISRFQVWENSGFSKLCKIVSGSCVFGVKDIPILVKRPELVVHKLYLNYQPAAYFCFYKYVRERALGNITDFNPKPYAEIPFVAVSKGARVEDVLFPLENQDHYW
ncbi:unnamed protein product [Enterobius vermicularis]|uniref:Core-2/I-Branching enzyme n=1 Tax=Enterobius vermicularis TaxID=51028 RepID=A0A0N4V333_ENTVE|nr:unnamed protein product [Enterobius vermicularis]